MGETAFDALYHALSDLQIARNVQMSGLTTFAIGGPAALVLYAKTERDIANALLESDALGVKTYIMGNGSNLLVSDEGLRALVIVVGKHMECDIVKEGDTLTVGAGMPLIALCRAALSHGLMGLEWASGIPGTVGGACAMNAGAYGGEIAQVIKRVRILKNGEIYDTAIAQDAFSYRKSIYTAPGCIVLRATFALCSDDGGAAARQAQYTEQRRKKQPLRACSAGSTFKRPQGHFAGALIEGAGLKGYSIGGAQVSDLHAGFLINTGGASCSDMRALITHVQNKVYEIYGVKLETEVQFWGEG